MPTADILWLELSALAEQEIHALGSRDLAKIQKLQKQRELLTGALREYLDKIEAYLWSKVNEAVSRFAVLPTEIEDFSSLLDDLTYLRDLLIKIKISGAFTIEEVEPPKVIPATEPQEIKPILPARRRVIKEVGVAAPKFPRAKKVPSRKPKVGRRDILGAERIRVLTAVLSDRNQKMIEATAELWPREYSVSDVKVQHKLMSRLRCARSAGLRIIARVMANLQLEDRLPPEEQEFYRRLHERFRSFAEVSSYAFRWKRGGDRRKQPASADVAITAPPLSTSEEATARVTTVVTASGTGTGTPLTGFMSENHASMIEAALLHPQGPTFDPETLAKRTNQTLGAVGPILIGSLKGLESLLHSYEAKRPLAPGAAQIVNRIRAKWPESTVEQIKRIIEGSDAERKENPVATSR